MADDSRLVSVRIDRRTLDELEIAASDYGPMSVDRRNQAFYPHYNRSEMIRHAIRTGLDVLTHAPPLQL